MAQFDSISYDRLSKDKSENNFSELHRKVIMGEKAQFQQLDRTQGL